MAFVRALLTSLLLALLLLYVVDASSEMSYQNEDINKPSKSSSLATINCGSACKVRCSKSLRPNLCHRARGTCYSICNCVPSGTYGNYQERPCFASLTTHGGRKKCP